MRFELTKEYLQAVETAIESNDTSWITENILELHDADIAAIIGELDHEYATDLFNRIPSDRKGDILIELDDDSRDHLLKGISAIDLANQLESLDSDDAADLISELSANEIEEVISHISDNEAAGDIVDLLNYDEDTAGGLMQKEFIKAKMDWPVNRCVVELRRQAEEVEKVYTYLAAAGNYPQTVAVSIEGKAHIGALFRHHVNKIFQVFRVAGVGVVIGEIPIDAGEQGSEMAAQAFQ